MYCNYNLHEGGVQSLLYVNDCVCVCREFKLVLAYLPAPPPLPISTPSLAMLRASRAGSKRRKWAGISPQVSGGVEERQWEKEGERGRHLPAASGKLREGIPPTTSSLLRSS